MSEEVFSHLARPSAKQSRPILLKMPLLRAWSGILAHIEKTYAPPGLHVKLAKREKTAEFNGLHTRVRLPVMQMGKD